MTKRLLDPFGHPWSRLSGRVLVFTPAGRLLRRSDDAAATTPAASTPSQ